MANFITNPKATGAEWNHAIEREKQEGDYSPEAGHIVRARVQEPLGDAEGTWAMAQDIVPLVRGKYTSNGGIDPAHVREAEELVRRAGERLQEDG